MDLVLPTSLHSFGVPPSFAIMGATRAVATVRRADGSTLYLNTAQALEIYLAASSPQLQASHSEEFVPILVAKVIAERAQDVANELACQYNATKALGIPCKSGSDVYRCLQQLGSSKADAVRRVTRKSGKSKHDFSQVKVGAASLHAAPQPQASTPDDSDSVDFEILKIISQVNVAHSGEHGISSGQLAHRIGAGRKHITAALYSRMEEGGVEIISPDGKPRWKCLNIFSEDYVCPLLPPRYAHSSVDGGDDDDDDAVI